MRRLRSTARRFAALPAAWLLPAGAAAVSGLLAAWQSLGVRSDPGLATAVSFGDGALGQVVFLQAIAVVLGGLVAGADLRPARLTRVWLAHPGRIGEMLRQAAVAWLAGSAVGVLGIGATVAGWAWAGGPTRVAADDALRCTGAVVWLGVLAVLAHGVTLLVRSLTVGVTALVALLFVLEPLVQFATRAAWWLPGISGRQLFLVAQGVPNTIGISPLAGGAIAFGWALLALAAALLVERRRDVGA